nr:hypothetical protein [Clostridia bacterium]
MDANKRLKAKFEACEKIYAGMINENTTLESAKACAGKFDFMFVDFEHGNLNQELARPILKDCREADIPIIARVQDCLYHLIAKSVDMGADGVMIPRTETIEQVETAVKSMRFFPRGKKGVGGAGLFRKGEKFEEINDHRYLILQIESPKGVATLDAMLTLYGDEVAGIVIGPCDMANTSGLGIDTHHPKVVEQVHKVIEICNKHNKPSGIFCENLADVTYYYNAGMRILWYGNDAPYFKGGEEAVKAVVASMDAATK